MTTLTPKPRRGRPRSLPGGTRVRGLRLTDAEFQAVKEFVKRLRKKKTLSINGIN